MSRDDIIRMAGEAGADCEFAVHIPTWDMSTWEFMKRFAALVAVAEREACAKELEAITDRIPVEQREGFVYMTLIECVAVIRARGENT